MWLIIGIMLGVLGTFIVMIDIIALVIDGVSGFPADLVLINVLVLAVEVVSWWYIMKRAEL